MLRLINGCLLILAVVGACFSIRAGLGYQHLRAKHRKLIAKVGRLQIEHPDKAHFVAIDTGEPLHYAWQMYVPASFDTQWKILGAGDGGSSGSLQPYFDLVRVRVRKQANGGATLWIKELGGSRMLGLDARQLALLEGQRFAIEQLGSEGTAVVGREQVVTLIRLSDPEQPNENPLVEIRFGTPQAFLLQEQ